MPYQMELDIPPALMIKERNGRYRLARGEEIIDAAHRELAHRFNKGAALTSPDDTREWLTLKFATRPYEVFAILHLDNRHRVLAFEEMFRGTIDGASVHPREVVTSALLHHSAACIFAHNHPSGVAEPSQADLRITQKLKEGLALVEVRTLDHIIVGGNSTCSLAQRGLL